MKETMRSLQAKLNNIIDSELKKDVNEIDDDLVMECCDSLLRMDDTAKYTITQKQIDENIESLFNSKPKRKVKKFKKTLKVLLIAAIIAIILTVAALGYAQIKYKIIDFSNHSVVFFNSANHEEIEDIKIGYIPDGFTLVKEQKQEYSQILTYQKDDYFINITKKSAEKNISVNSEHKQTQIIRIGETDYVIYGESGHGEGIIWVKNGFEYAINSNISKEEVIKIVGCIS